MRVPVLLWLLPLAAAAGFAAARMLVPSSEGKARLNSLTVQSDRGLAGMNEKAAVPVLKEAGSGQIPEIFAAVANASAPDLRRIAIGLLADRRRRRDLGVWGPVVARWAEVDGASLIAFVHHEVPPGEKPWLEAKAWFAWGAANPQVAADAGKELPAALAKELIGGMTQTDARMAVSVALKLPGAQSNLYDIATHVAATAPELVSDLLPRTVYHQMRQDLERARATELTRINPEAALALARSGKMGFDPVPETMRHIAEHDPVKAAQLLSEMPSSRSRALSALALAKTWAARDAAAAVTWTRQSLTGPVRQAALLEIAGASGGPDPLAALQLVEEAGWKQAANFHRIADGGLHSLLDRRERRTPARTAGTLLQQLALLDRAAAERFLQQRVPESLRSEVAGYMDPFPRAE